MNKGLNKFHLTAIWLGIILISIFTFSEISKCFGAANSNDRKLHNDNSQTTDDTNGKVIKTLKVSNAVFASRSGTEVHLIEIDGHEYVIVAVYSGAADGGSGTSIIHHVGCKACQHKGD